MEFESFFLAVIAANAIILSVLAIIVLKTGGRGQFALRISFSILLLVQVRLMNFLGTPVPGDGPSAIDVFPAQFAIMFWMLAGSLALVVLSLRQNFWPGSQHSRNRRCGWRAAILIAITL